MTTTSRADGRRRAPTDLPGLLTRMDDGDAVELRDEGLRFGVRYDEEPAYGDDGAAVRGDVTGEYAVTEDDDVVFRQYVAPHGTSGHGNPNAKRWAAEQVAGYVTTRLHGAKRARAPDNGGGSFGPVTGEHGGPGL